MRTAVSSLLWITGEVQPGRMSGLLRAPGLGAFGNGHCGELWLILWQEHG